MQLIPLKMRKSLGIWHSNRILEHVPHDGMTLTPGEAQLGFFINRYVVVQNIKSFSIPSPCMDVHISLNIITSTYIELQIDNAVQISSIIPKSYIEAKIYNENINALPTTSVNIILIAIL